MENIMQIPFSPPDISEAEVKEVAEALRSGWNHRDKRIYCGRRHGYAGGFRSDQGEHRCAETFLYVYDKRRRQRGYYY